MMKQGGRKWNRQDQFSKALMIPKYLPSLLGAMALISRKMILFSALIVLHILLKLKRISGGNQFILCTFPTKLLFLFPSERAHLIPNFPLGSQPWLWPGPHKVNVLKALFSWVLRLQSLPALYLFNAGFLQTGALGYATPFIPNYGPCWAGLMGVGVPDTLGGRQAPQLWSLGTAPHTGSHGCNQVANRAIQMPNYWMPICYLMPGHQSRYL